MVNQSPVVRELFSDVSPLGKLLYDDKLLHLHCDSPHTIFTNEDDGLSARRSEYLHVCELYSPNFVLSLSKLAEAQAAALAALDIVTMTVSVSPAATCRRGVMYRTKV